MVTTTSYGTWLPSARRYVDEGRILPADPQLADRAASPPAHSPVHFDDSEQMLLFDALCRAADDFRYRLTDVAVESWHLHWIVEHGSDPISKMVSRLRTRMQQALDRGRIWTEGYCRQCLYTPAGIEIRRQYIARHRGCRMIKGKRLGDSC